MQSYPGGGPIVPSTTGWFLGLGASVDACISYHLVVERLVDIFIDRLLRLQLPLLLVYRCASCTDPGTFNWSPTGCRGGRIDLFQ